MENNEDISFIARHFREGRFSTDKALKLIKSTGTSFWTPIRIAAASAILVALSATAALLIHNTYFNAPGVLPETTEVVAPEAVVHVIDFENTPLPVVTAKISEVYGVEIVNIPENADDYMLSLHYEGNALDLIDTINVILGTSMEIENQ